MRATHSAFLRRGLEQGDKFAGIGKRKGPQEHGVDDAEDGGVGADAERERDRRDDAQARRFHQHAQAKFDVLNNSVHRFKFLLSYSSLSAINGSTLLARLAGK